MSPDAQAVLGTMKTGRNGSPRNAKGIAADLRWVRDGEGSWTTRVNRRRAVLALEELEKLGLVKALMTGAGQRWKRL